MREKLGVALRGIVHITDGVLGATARLLDGQLEWKEVHGWTEVASDIIP